MMKRLILALSAGALVLASAPAWADGYEGRGSGYKRHGYGHGGYSYSERYEYRERRSYGRRHRDDSALIGGVLAGGLVLGYLLSRPAYSAPAYRAPVTYAPPPPVLGNCQATVGTGYYQGRPAQFGGTMCFDRYGRGYVTPGSRYFMGYLR
jgi:hypothetical protein